MRAGTTAAAPGKATKPRLGLSLAALLHLPEGTVASRLRRARSRMAELLPGLAAGGAAPVPRRPDPPLLQGVRP